MKIICVKDGKPGCFTVLTGSVSRGILCAEDHPCQHREDPHQAENVADKSEFIIHRGHLHLRDSTERTVRKRKNTVIVR